MLHPQRGPIIISTRPRSAALLPVGTASTGLLCLSVGARVHHIRSDTGNHRVWLQPRVQHFQCMTIMNPDIPGWAQLKLCSPKHGCRPTSVATRVCKCGPWESQGRVIHSCTRGFSPGSLCVCAAGVACMMAYLEGKDELRQPLQAIVLYLKIELGTPTLIAVYGTYITFV